MPTLTPTTTRPTAVAAPTLEITGPVVPGSEQVAFPSALVEARKCGVGLAMRRVSGERGRPALQLLLLGREVRAAR